LLLGVARVVFVRCTSTSTFYSLSLHDALPISSTILGIDLFDYTLFFEMPGHSDGPSAGGIMTAGLAAALLGHSLFPHATMTGTIDRKSTRLNSSHVKISYAVFCSKKKQRVATI